MALWLVRAGRSGEHQQKFIQDKRIYLTWGDLKLDLAKLDSQKALYDELKSFYPNAKVGRLRQNAGQIWPFAHQMQKGDWVVVPNKRNPSINIAEIAGDYVYDPSAENPYYHNRAVKWVAQDIPRSNFDQDILLSFGAFMTICRIQRNDAEARVRAMAVNKWQTTGPSMDVPPDAEGEAYYDLEEVTRTQIAQMIERKFKGKDLERLVNEILKAKGHTTHWDPRQKSDGGVDILAASGLMGFGNPKICVQVKSEARPIGIEVLDRLVGTMDKVKADQGLLVAWGGFKDTVMREQPNHFFRVRMWDQDDIIDEVLDNYEKLGDEIRAELPLKRIWTVATDDEE